jgi:transmembrane sensor
MRNYSSYTIDDFAMDPDFIRWVLHPEPSDLSFWSALLLEHPGLASDISAARLIVASMHIQEIAVPSEQVLQSMDKVLAQTNSSGPPRFVLRPWTWLAAASVAGLLMAAGVYYYYSRPSVPVPVPVASNIWSKAAGDSLLEAKNTGTTALSLHLADNSVITLRPGAVVRYKQAFLTQSKRVVYLEGNADFDVEKVANKPFEVYSQDLVTRVLGTSFSIVNGGGIRRISVIVHSGKVSVSRIAAEASGIGSIQPGVILTPNQKLIYDETPKSFQKQLLDTPALINPLVIQHHFVYDDAPVTEVLEELKKAFDIDIEYDQDVLKNCRISADLSDESLSRKLDLICSALGARYEMIDGAVSIQAGRPCQ